MSCFLTALRVLPLRALDMEAMARNGRSYNLNLVKQRKIGHGWGRRDVTLDLLQPAMLESIWRSLIPYPSLRRVYRLDPSLVEHLHGKLQEEKHQQRSFS